LFSVFVMVIMPVIGGERGHVLRIEKRRDLLTQRKWVYRGTARIRRCFGEAEVPGV